MKNICVYAGSGPGAGDLYREAARDLGAYLAGRGIGIVYGAGRLGTMGELADAAIEAGGEVVGVIPRFMTDAGREHASLTELRVVETMHERKETMARLSDGFIALPGGAGTLEEFMEVFTWAQLGLHAKPCGLLNVNGYYDRFLHFLDNMTEERFLMREHRDAVLVDDSPGGLLDHFERYCAPDVEKWLYGTVNE